jgi:REP-associated tyrosine transposase
MYRVFTILTEKFVKYPKRRDAMHCVSTLPSKYNKMPDKFNNKFRIPSARLQTWDYSNCASYFITICTKKRAHFFGEIKDKKMQLNDIGKIAEKEWIKTLELRPDMNLELGEFVMMPNHFHGIIIIGENKYNTPAGRDAMHRVSDINVVTNTRDISNIDKDAMHGRDAMHRVSTTTTTTNQFGPQSKNLASIVRGFKSAVTTQAKKQGNDIFGWQPRFYDHIIRNTESFERIQNYIIHNAFNWENDKFYD